MFSTLSQTKFAFLATFKLSSASALNLDKFYILSFGNGLNLYHSITSFKSLSDDKILNCSNFKASADDN